MTHLILLLSIILAPVIILTLLKVDATMVFLSLCLGSVLVRFLGSDTNSFISAFYPRANSLSNSTMLIGLMLLPVVLTIFFMFHTAKGSKLIVNLIPALCVGLLGALLIEPLLSPGTQVAIQSTTLWQHFTQAQALVVGGSSIIVLVLLWMRRSGSQHSEKKHRSKS